MHKENFLVTRADHDDMTHYLFVWTGEVIDFAKRKGFKVIDLARERATRAQFVSVVSDKDPKFILFNGHGKPERITGQDGENVVVLGENHDILKSRIIYARSCWAAQGLGKKCEEMSEDGCFIGYSMTYIFIADNNCMSRPLKDELARPFMESSNIIPISILKGNSTKEAMGKSEKKMRECIEFFESSGMPGHADVSFFLKWNLDNQTICGNPEASLDN